MGIEIRAAESDREVDAAYELAARVFGPDYFTARDMKTRIRLLEPVRRFSDVIVAASGGEVVGFVRIVDRAVRLGGKTLTVGGITSVCLRPDFRGQGYGRAIMEEALEASKGRGDALSIAFARRAVDGFYPRLGYLGLGCHPELVAAIAPGAFPLAREVRIEPGLEAGRLDLYAAAYVDSYDRLALSFDRDGDWWTKVELRLASRIAQNGFVTVLVGARPAGYFVSHGGQIGRAHV